MKTIGKRIKFVDKTAQRKQDVGLTLYGRVNEPGMAIRDGKLQYFIITDDGFSGWYPRDTFKFTKERYK